MADTELAQLLRVLRINAGAPSVREIGERAGVSHTLVHNALSGSARVSWESVCRIIAVLDGDPDDFRSAWERAEHRTPSGPADRVLRELRVLQLWARLSERRLDVILDRLTPEMLAAGLVPGLPPLSEYVTGIDHGRVTAWHDVPGCQQSAVIAHGGEFVRWIVAHHQEAHGGGA